jgi:hypothetical protein
MGSETPREVLVSCATPAGLLCETLREDEAYERMIHVS